MTDDAKRRKIRQLRALAESTTFPHEAASARAKADKLEAGMGGPARQSHFAGPEQVPPPYRQRPDPRHYADAGSYLDQMMREELQRRLDEILRGAQRG